MKKRTYYKPPQISPEQVAANLKEELGKDHALKIAKLNAEALSKVEATDINLDIFCLDNLRKDGRLWLQVAHILVK